MNKQKFTQIVKDYHDISADDRNKLHELVSDYPYSQIIHTLVAKANMDAKTDIAKQTLGYAAMYAADRSVLKEIIEEKSESFKKSTTTTTSASEPVVSKKAAAKKADEQSTTANDKKETDDSESPELFLSKGTKVTVDEDLLHQDFSLQDEILRDLQALEASKATYQAWVEEEKESKPTTKKNTTAKTASAKKTTAKKATTKKAAPKKKTTTKSTTTKASSKKPTTSKKVSSAKTRATAKKADEKKSTAKKTTTSRRKTTAKTTKKEAPKTTKAKTTSKKTTAKSSNDAKSKTTATKSKSTTKKASSTKTKPVKKKHNQDQIEIIDKFISKEPSITAKASRKSSTNQEDLSQPSTEFTEDLVSENLAKIFISQGKSDKAIDIYKKLIWKFPQKKAYFATQIEKLKK